MPVGLGLDINDLETFSSRIHYIDEQGNVEIFFGTALFDENRGISIEDINDSVINLKIIPSFETRA